MLWERQSYGHEETFRFPNGTKKRCDGHRDGLFVRYERGGSEDMTNEFLYRFASPSKNSSTVELQTHDGHKDRHFVF